MDDKIWNINEINPDDLAELNREIGRNIKGLIGDPKQLSRIANMAAQKIGLVRALIHAERILDNPSREHKEVI